MGITVVIGANRGIGLGLVQVFRARGDEVYATARTPAPGDALHESGARVLKVDIDDAGAVDRLADDVPAGINLLVINAGVSGPAHRSAQQVTAAELGALFYTNAIAPLRVARALAPRLAPDAVVGFMSSVLGSIEANTGGGHELYRASKAALNSLARTFSHEVPALAVLSLHPGWVRTDMGGANAAVSVEQSTEGLARVLDAARGRAGHRFVEYTGKTIPW